MGLGLLGRGVGDAIFLAQCGAKLTVTDLKSSQELRPSLSKLRKYKSIKYVLGEHRLEDFRNADLILKAAGVPFDSPHIREAIKQKIPVEMSAALFAKLSGLPIIGVTGTRGKSTVAHLIAQIFSWAGKKVILGGNVRGVSNLQLLRKANPPAGGAEMAVLELDSWQLQGFGESKISPHISVFTNFLSDHLNYYGTFGKYFGDKSNIYKFQTQNDFLVLGSRFKKKIKTKAKIIRADIKKLPKFRDLKLKGSHNLQNIACAIEVARVLKIPEQVIKKAVENFETIPGRLELVKIINAIKIYNDTNATTPDATIAALNSFDKKVILIAGGADKGLDVKILNKELNKKTKKIFLLPGSGSDRIKSKNEKVKSLEDAVKKVFAYAKSGDIILFSPGFASFNMFNNEYDRGDKFMKIVKKLK